MLSVLRKSDEAINQLEDSRDMKEEPKDRGG
jgi:hypothetical protein